MDQSGHDAGALAPDDRLMQNLERFDATFLFRQGSCMSLPIPPNNRWSERAVNQVLVALQRCVVELWRQATYRRGGVTIPVTVLLLSCLINGGAVAGGPLTKASSCSLLKKTVARLDSLPVTGPPGAGWFCDFSNLSGNRWFVVALRSNRACSGDCSNLMGWYAINRRNGQIHSYDIAKLRVGLPL